MTRRQRCLDNCPPYQPSEDQTSLFPQGFDDKPLLLKTLHASLLGSRFCGPRLVFSISYGRLGEGGTPVAGCQSPIVSRQMTSADDFDSLSASGKEQIPRRLKPTRDDKNKGPRRGAEAPHYPNECFERPVKLIRDDERRGMVMPRLELRPFNLARCERRIAKSASRIAKSGDLRFGESYAG